MFPLSAGFLTSLSNQQANSFRLQFVRFRRKPRWLPVAKSKRFRIPDHKPKDPVETAELLRLNNNYRTQMRSIRTFLHEDVQNSIKKSSADHLVLSPEQEQKEIDDINAINEEWNKKIAAERDERLKNLYEEKRAYIKERLDLATERELCRLEKVENIVKMQKEKIATYITKKEEVDNAIEHALANPVSYNKPIYPEDQLEKN